MKRFSSLLRENLHLLYYNEVLPDFQIKFCKRKQGYKCHKDYLKMWEIQPKCLCMYRSVDFSPLNRIKAIRPYFGIYVSFSVSTILMGNIVRKDKNQDATFANVLLFEDFYCLEHSGKEGGGQHQKWVQTYFSNCFCYWRTYY